MARSDILLGNEIDRLASLGLPFAERAGDFKIDFIGSPPYYQKINSQI
jgi:hypothetical protein